MDSVSVLGLASSLIAVMDAGVKTSLQLRSYRNLPRKGVDLADSIDEVTMVFQALIRRIQIKPTLLSSEGIISLSSVVERTRDTLEIIAKHISPTPNVSNVRRIKMLLFLNGQDLDNFLKRLDRLQSELSLFLQLDNLQIHDHTQELSSAIAHEIRNRLGDADSRAEDTVRASEERRFSVESQSRPSATRSHEGVSRDAERSNYIDNLKPRHKHFFHKTCFAPDKNGLLSLPLTRSQGISAMNEDQVKFQEFDDELESRYTRAIVSRKVNRAQLTEGLASPPTDGGRGSIDKLLQLRLIICDVCFRSLRPNGISFSEQGFVGIMADFRLPAEFFRVMVTGTPVLLCLEDDIEGLTSFVMRTPISNSQNWTIALSWDYKARTTFAVLHGFQEKELACLLHELKEFLFSSTHPLLLPTLLCELLTEADSNGIKRLASELFEVENKTTWHGNWQPGKIEDSVQQQTPEQDFEYLTRMLNNIISRLAFHEMRLNANVTLVSNLFSHFPPITEPLVSPHDGVRHDGIPQAEWRPLAHALSRRLTNLQSEHAALLLEISCNQKIAAGQLQIVYNLIAQRDNKENLRMAAISTNIAAITKDDSFAMRTIAVMTIAFLPATAISSMFSMSMFNWQAGQTDPVVSTRFWIYWVVAVPLTLGVLGLWFAWMHTHKKHEEKQPPQKLATNTLEKKKDLSESQRQGLLARVQG